MNIQQNIKRRPLDNQQNGKFRFPQISRYPVVQVQKGNSVRFEICIEKSEVFSWVDFLGGFFLVEFVVCVEAGHSVILNSKADRDA